MNKYIFFKAAILSVTVFITGCTSVSQSDSESKPSEENLIIITDKQFKKGDMKLGNIAPYNFENRIDCNGYVTAAPDGIESVSTRLGGIINKISVAAGDKVKAGDAICEVTSNEFITMQKEFAITSARLKQLSADYKRAKLLYEQEIGSEKEFLSIESEYKVMLANNKALKIQLQQLHLNTANIEAGNFYKKLMVYAKITGRISDVYVNLGQYAEAGQKLAEIVNPKSFQLKLSVFEKDIKLLKKGQKIDFYTVNNTSQIYSAILSGIGKSIDKQTKTITCFATIENNIWQKFINNSFINAQVITNKQSAPAIVNDAIVKVEHSYFVLTLSKNEDNNYYFNKTRVKIGRESKSHTEILENSNLKNILVKGVYNLQIE